MAPSFEHLACIDIENVAELTVIERPNAVFRLSKKIEKRSKWQTNYEEVH